MQPYSKAKNLHRKVETKRLTNTKSSLLYLCQASDMKSYKVFGVVRFGVKLFPYLVLNSEKMFKYCVIPTPSHSALENTKSTRKHMHKHNEVNIALIFVKPSISTYLNFTINIVVYAEYIFFFFFFRLLPIRGHHPRESIFQFSRSTSSSSLAPTLSMSSPAKSIHLLLGLPLFLLPGTAISIIVFHT